MVGNKLYTVHAKVTVKKSKSTKTWLESALCGRHCMKWPRFKNREFIVRTNKFIHNDGQ